MCVYICLELHPYTCIQMYVSIQTYVYACVYECTCERGRAPTRIVASSRCLLQGSFCTKEPCTKELYFTHLYPHKSPNLYICICVYICAPRVSMYMMYIYIYRYVCAYVYIYIDMYVYTCIIYVAFTFTTAPQHSLAYFQNVVIVH